MHWFLDPIKNHYADFEGRATRKEFWMYILVYVIIVVVASFVASIFNAPILVFLLGVAVLLPNLAIAARRLHDTGKSGWWQLIGLIPYIGALILIVLLAQKGQKGPNKYGPDPLISDSEVN